MNKCLSFLTAFFIFAGLFQFHSNQALAGADQKPSALTENKQLTTPHEFFENFAKKNLTSYCDDCMKDCVDCAKYCWPADGVCAACKNDNKPCPSECDNCGHCDSCIPSTSIDPTKGYCCKSINCKSPHAPTCSCKEASTCVCTTDSSGATTCKSS